MTLFMAAVASTTSSNSGTLPPTRPVLPPCAWKSISFACYMQQEAAKPNLCDCTKILQAHATVCKAVAQPVQAPTRVNLQYVVLHMMIRNMLHLMKCATLQACLWYNCKLSLIAVLQNMGHLLCSLGFQS